MIPDANEIFQPMREDLSNWRQRVPDNYYTVDANFRSSLLHWMAEDSLREAEDLLERVGAEAATVLNEWAIETNRDENLPRLRRYDGNGERLEAVDFNPLYHEMGRRVYGSGIMSRYAHLGQDVVQMALYYLYAQNGEAGHGCPLACTAGAIKLIQRAGSAELKERFLPRLLDPDYDTHLHASQFLTELQGGSDVGANATVAVPSQDGTWRLYGEKWFCSVSDAGLMVLTARPQGALQGTRGLTTFVAPRHLEDGTLNHFEIKRLKDKIGTRSMATAEMDLKGMLAYAVGEPGEGFKYVVDIVLNTSRLYNGFAAAGITRRAYLEALGFARARRAFGRPVVEFPLVKRTLASLRAEAALQLASCMHIAALSAKIANGTADEGDRGEFRFLVNANKYWTAIRCTRAVRDAIEIFGGNGTIEEFSVLPRLYRDAIVIESWEGTHNVLCQQILRDMGRYQVHRHVLERAGAEIAKLSRGVFSRQALALQDALNTCGERAARLLSMEAVKAQVHIRPWLDRTFAVIQATDLLREASAENERGQDTGKARVVDYRILTRIREVDPFGSDELLEIEETLV